MSTKWAQIDDSLMPARKFARGVLAERVDGVESLLPKAAHHHSEDVEHVHQLRVGCRRASAALRAFAPLMSKKAEHLKKWLRSIRDAAGPARDIDVLLARFAREQADAVSSYAIDRLLRERVAAQKPLVKVAKRASSGKFEDAIRTALDLLSAGSKKPRIQEFGRDAVRLSYLPFARLSLLDNPTTNDLHELRIAGKRLRYSLEIFHDLDSTAVDQLYPIVEELQARLGDINDHATAQALYQSWLGEIPAGALAVDLAARVIHEHKRGAQLAGQFVRWWGTKRVATVQDLVTQFCS